MAPSRRVAAGDREEIMRAVVAGAVVFACVVCFGSTAHGQAGSEQEMQRHTERMAREHAGDAPVANPLSEAPPARDVVTEAVTYARVGEAEVSGYMARPEDAGDRRPGVIVIHEWWGLNENVRAMTRRLAAEGFIALAVDLYTGRTADTPEDARELMQGVNEQPELARSNLLQAARWLRDQGVPSVGSLGWCFGGGWSLQTALILGDDLDAAVIYYGFVDTDPDALGPLEAPVLAFFGGEDRGIPLDRVKEFETALESLGKTFEVVVFPDAGHAFANPSGRNWEPVAADAAWSRTIAFLHEQLDGR
jgi:carboxymethylenebutenolidase